MDDTLQQLKHAANEPSMHRAEEPSRKKDNPPCHASDPVPSNPGRKAEKAEKAEPISSAPAPDVPKTVRNEQREQRPLHSTKAQRIVMIKGFFDIFLSLSLLVFPSLLYDGPIPRFISFVTGLSRAHWDVDTSSAFALSSMIMGCGFAALSAGKSSSDSAYKAVAALNGVFAAMALFGCLVSPQKFGSSFLIIAALQDAFWFSAIVKAGEFGVMDTLGLSWEVIEQEAEKVMKQGAKKYSEKKRALKEGGPILEPRCETSGERLRDPAKIN